MNDKKNFKDLTIVCKTCSKEFVYTATEQAFFADKGFGAPIRCQECRAAKKERNNNKTEVETTSVDEVVSEVEIAPIKYTDPDTDWVTAMNERWNNHLVLFGDKE